MEPLIFFVWCFHGRFRMILRFFHWCFRCTCKNMCFGGRGFIQIDGGTTCFSRGRPNFYILAVLQERIIRQLIHFLPLNFSRWHRLKHFVMFNTINTSPISLVRIEKQNTRRDRTQSIAAQKQRLITHDRKFLISLLYHYTVYKILFREICTAIVNSKIQIGKRHKKPNGTDKCDLNAPMKKANKKEWPCENMVKFRPVPYIFRNFSTRNDKSNQYTPSL